MSPVYDLHCHSDQSDGALSPEEVVIRAAERNVTCLALTDHDTINGLARAKQQSERTGIDLVAGIEFSSQWMGKNVHIVGLNFDISNASLQQAVLSQERARESRAEIIATKLEKAGIASALEGAKSYTNGGAVGRPHFARYLVEQGVVSNISQAFKRYLGAGKMGDVKSNWPEIAEVVGWITQAGGTAVLAHPAKYKMTRTKLCLLTEQFADVGGGAIEVVSGKQPVGLAGNLAKIANQFKLAGSSGSDFHVPGQPWQELGCADRLPSTVQPVWDLWSR
jgi:Predicted metal-dependent phosphoesterases (PHP family)